MPKFKSTTIAFILALIALDVPALAGELRLLRTNPDPYGSPRPFPGQTNVPLRTTFYIELAPAQGASDDIVLPESVTVELEREGAKRVPLLTPDRQFSAGCAGRMTSAGTNKDRKLIIYIDPGGDSGGLMPATTYIVRVSARSRAGDELASKSGTWQFTTEQSSSAQPVTFSLSLKAPSVTWHGGFFTGFCGVSFCTNYANRVPTFELMEAVRKQSPKAWNLQRDFWLTGMDRRPEFLKPNLPNLVRERETRRVKAIEPGANETLLRVEDFFGHEQYGIASGRPLSGDYHAGDEVLIADGVHDARGKVLAVDDAGGTIRVSKITEPAGGWKLQYAAPLPTAEDPTAPGLFASGGTYLQKFAPAGTPAYYWGRLDSEWDLAHKRFKRRLVVNFADAPGDLSIDGRNWTTTKDYAELHEAIRAITGHIIDRYGDDAFEFVWSVFNEPDLGALFWRSDWNELQKFYDYAVDGILRAFEEKGRDSNRVFVGGLELGGIFGPNLRLGEFLAHCSPRAEVKGAILLNAAYADRRLDGKRSRRVEELCRAHAGRGVPCDFVSIHAYNGSQMMARKLIRAKEMALEIDPEHYATLWINSHESCPGWSPPPDPAFSDSYLGNGYFETWCANVASRLLRRAAGDARFAYGESILTAWPWPSENFAGINDCVRKIHVDDDGDGIEDRTITVANPILHFLGLVASMGPGFIELPEQVFGGHVVSGFASPDGEGIKLLLYSHDGLDTESRSQAEFDVTVKLAGLEMTNALVREYRFDKDHNSYFRRGRALREQAEGASAPPDPKTAAVVEAAVKDLSSDRVEARLLALDRLAALGTKASSAAAAIFPLFKHADDPQFRERAETTLKRITAARAYPAADVREIEDASRLRETSSRESRVAGDGWLSITVRVAGNGANVVHVIPAP